MLLKTKERREIIAKLTSLDSAWNANTRYRDCNATQAQDDPFAFWFAAQLALKDPDMQLRLLVDASKPIPAG